MRQKLAGLLILLVGITMTAAVAGAREIERRVPIIDDAIGVVPMGNVFGLNAAMAGTDTFYYGGTVISGGGEPLAAVPAVAGWANRKMWSFSSAGFNGTPHSGLFMDGWRGVDNTTQATDYMHVASDTSANPYLNIGTCVLAGTKSLFCGVTNAQGINLCYKDNNGTGYGNSMYQTVVTKSYTYAASDQISLVYKYHNESEAGFDYSYAILQIYDTGAGEWVTLDTMATYTDVVSGTETIDVDSYLSALTPPVSFRIAFNFDSDGGYSDEDGLNPTVCGGLEIDDYSLTINATVDSENFEAVAEGALPAGWAHYYAGCGDYAHVKHVNDLPVMLSEDICYGNIGAGWCEMADSVLVFYDENNLGYGHPLCQDNFAYCPVVDFEGHPGLPGKLFSCERFGYSPIVMYIFFYYQARYAPACESGGWSGWLSDGYVYYTGETAT
ncbi:MAG: hypothetical protein NTX17_00005, partial [Candidatus Eisenbacteria bacterium]|nr:hypothetical protein [Candidatus Eisenbacteria bacterium]